MFSSHLVTYDFADKEKPTTGTVSIIKMSTQCK